MSQWAPEPVTRTCPQCGAINPRRAASCWLCYANLGEAGPGGEPSRPPAPGSPVPGSHSLLAAVTGGLLVALVLLVGLGILLTAEGPWRLLGPLFLLASAPALVRIFRSEAPGGAVPPEGPLGVFGVALAAVGITALVIMAAVVMFVVTCFPVGLATVSLNGRGNDAGALIAFVVGIVAAGGGAYLVTLAFFRRRDRRPPQRGPEQ
jgi:hypothetical protein